MEFKGTEGKWEIMMDGDEIKIIQADSLENGAGWRSYIAICEEVQCIEDANLIAAAPDLLNALKAMLNKAYKQNWNDHYPDEVSKAQSAIREGANKQVISSQADSLIKISRIWADFFPANTSNQPI